MCVLLKKKHIPLSFLLSKTLSGSETSLSGRVKNISKGLAMQCTVYNLLDSSKS